MTPFAKNYLGFDQDSKGHLGIVENGDSWKMEIHGFTNKNFLFNSNCVYTYWPKLVCMHRIRVPIGRIQFIHWHCISGPPFHTFNTGALGLCFLIIISFGLNTVTYLYDNGLWNPCYITQLITLLLY